MRLIIYISPFAMTNILPTLCFMCYKTEAETTYLESRKKDRKAETTYLEAEWTQILGLFGPAEKVEGRNSLSPVIPGEAVVAQHRPLCAVLKIKPEKERKIKAQKRIKIWNLKGTKIAAFQEKVRSRKT